MEETAGRATKRNLRRSRLIYLMQITGLEKPTPLAALYAQKYGKRIARSTVRSDMEAINTELRTWSRAINTGPLLALSRLVYTESIDEAEMCRNVAINLYEDTRKDPRQARLAVFAIDKLLSRADEQRTSALEVAKSIPAMACLREIALQTPMDKLKDEYGMPNVKGEMV